MAVTLSELTDLSPLFAERVPARLRAAFRRGEWTQATRGLAPGYTQANLAILPREDAYDFLLFCQRNPKPCPIIEVTDVGLPEPRRSAPGADLRTDLPRYKVFRQGQLVDELTDITSLWRDDFVAFLLGCSITFETALLESGVPIRSLEEKTCSACAFVTNIECDRAGKFHGPMVVSMRPMTPAQAVRATQITTRFSATHGAPIHFGDPAAIGIGDLSKPDFGRGVTIREGEIPVFWACGITPQTVALASNVPFMITHYPGSMFITDLKDAEVAVL